jgi:hypothetical protein
MTAVMTKPGKIKGTKLDEHRAYVGELKMGIEKLNGSLEDSRRRQESLVAERGLLVLPARANKNKEAQNRLRTIDEQLAPLGQDIADDQAAVAELSAQLILAQNEVSRAELEEERVKVRGLLVMRMKSKSAENLLKAARELAGAIDTAAQEDLQLREDLRPFSGYLGVDVDQLKFLTRIRQLALGFVLIKHLPIDTREFYASSPNATGLEQKEQRYLGELLEALDGLELAY